MKLILTKRGSFTVPLQNEDFESLLLTHEYKKTRVENDFRNYRNSLLSETDWIITKSLESGVGVSSEWSSYRQELRDLTTHERFPDKFLKSDWPLAPGETQIPKGAEIFIPEISDPLGIGTTSWIGITTTGEYYFQERPQPPVEELPSEEPPIEEPPAE